jgi:hypothetical protein
MALELKTAVNILFSIPPKSYRALSGGQFPPFAKSNSKKTGIISESLQFIHMTFFQAPWVP